jgi:hypothetical protein
MRNIFTSAVAAATLAVAAGVAAPAAAVTFQGSYDVTAHTTDTPGLTVGVQKLSPTNLNFSLDSVGDTYTRDLFKIWTDETDVDPGEDTVAQPIDVAFSFTLPEIFGGDVDGTTNGESYWVWGFFNVQQGTVTWNDDGVLPFSGGQLQIHLSNETFNEGLYGTEEGRRYGSKVAATFTLLPPGAGGVGGVPEPASWALMICGFGFAGGMLRHKRRIMAA